MDDKNTWHDAIRFIAADGCMLSGSYFPASSGDKTPVLICPATGVKQGFYYAFAQWLSEQGHSVLVFDYRGIGASLAEPHVRYSKARKQDWGEQDMPAALNWLLSKTAAQQAHLIGHSAGAQLVGLMPNHRAVRSLTAVSASSGYIGNIRWPFRAMAMFFMWCYIPLSVRLLGYAPAKRLGWGEDLPAGVARQWADWCRRPGYVENAFGTEIKRHYYAVFQAPIAVVAASDDALVTQRSIEDWLRLLPNARHAIHLLQPTQVGGQAIGHINMFRRSHAALWPQLIVALSEK
ncbi:alpha/beta hydrolase [Serratia marcescens]|uniref:Alpha/beta hydrolase n=1 Tax=Serratia marcescens TaxID=615 RepID=A0A1Q4P5V7_SERMA|nr:alpha/beta fold hydrolase [Serratia marcescens]OKB68541.1 alpha/beta hydrolase [Serratia marcescens]